MCLRVTYSSRFDDRLYAGTTVCATARPKMAENWKRAQKHVLWKAGGDLKVAEPPKVYPHIPGAPAKRYLSEGVVISVSSEISYLSILIMGRLQRT